MHKTSRTRNWPIYEWVYQTLYMPFIICIIIIIITVYIKENILASITMNAHISRFNKNAHICYLVESWNH